MGVDRFSAISSDNTGNTRKAREIVTTACPKIMNFPDPMHHLNNTVKDFAKLSDVAKPIKTCAALARFFKKSNQGMARLQAEQAIQNITKGIESISKTRFSTSYRCASSVRRCLPAIKSVARTTPGEKPSVTLPKPKVRHS